jgi:hypothetical protein
MGAEGKGQGSTQASALELRESGAHPGNAAIGVQARQPARRDAEPIRSYHQGMQWRCPHCETPQPEASRCWVCHRSSTSCGTCRHFRRSVAERTGFCALDRRRRPLRGDEVRACWEDATAPVVPEPAVPGLLGLLTDHAHGDPAPEVVPFVPRPAELPAVRANRDPGNARDWVEVEA